MTPEEWQRIRPILESALELDPASRPGFLDAACSDPSLRREVESLIAADEQGRSGFLQSAPVRRLVKGTRLGEYEIQSMLGSGGMGEVYRARDLRLGRDVAIKVLPSFVAPHSDRLRRFELEARAAAALNHTNILAVYQMGTYEGAPYLVSELLEGETLREHMRRGAIPVRKAIDYAIQVAHGLAAAHEKGIVHRDLKPENLFVTKDGRVKILDFGLAKLTQPQPCSEHSATRSEGTEPGVIMGTVGYMSPEQVRGQNADDRADIFAFGATLYEVLTGHRAFDKATSADTMSAILQEDPPRISQISPGIALGLQRVVHRCLEKNPEQRFQSAHDLAFAMEALSESAIAAAIPERVRPRPFTVASRKGKAFIVSLAVALVGLALVAAVLWRVRSYSTPPKRFELVPITTYPGQEIQPSLSPDGTQVAFSWNGTTQDKFHIFVKAIGPGPPLQLTQANADDIAPAWSPDGSSIAFLRERSRSRFAVLVIPALGGPERQLTEVSIPGIISMPGPYLSWTPDSRSLAFPDRPTPDKPTAIFLSSIQIGDNRQMTFPPAGTLGDSCVALSPDARGLAFCRCTQMGAFTTDVYAIKLDPQLRPITDPQTLVGGHPLNVNGLTWNRSGAEIVFAASRPGRAGDLGLWRVPAPNASAVPASEIEVGIAKWPSAARLSSRLAFARATGGGLNIWRLPIAGAGKAHGPPSLLIGSTRQEFAARYSPDGQRIAFESDRTGNLEIWTCNSEGQVCQQVTSIGSAFSGYPSWSPDGKQVVFYSRVSDKSHIFVIGADGTGLRQLTFGDSNQFVPMWSKDGKWIYFSSSITQPVQIWKISPQGGAPVQATWNGGFAAFESPDGKWLYYTKSQAPDASFWKVAVTGGEEVQVLSSVRISSVDLVPDGIYFREGPTTLKFRDNAGRVSTVAKLPSGYVGLSVSPDRKWIIFTAAKPQTSELIMIQNFQ